MREYSIPGTQRKPLDLVRRGDRVRYSLLRFAEAVKVLQKSSRVLRARLGAIERLLRLALDTDERVSKGSCDSRWAQTRMHPYRPGGSDLIGDCTVLVCL
jgi:hypothetical protein